MFQDGSDRLPTDSPPTPSATPRHPPAAAPQLAGTGDSPRRSIDAAEARLEAGREQGLPRSADGPTLSRSITPPPRRWSPSREASDRRRTGRGAPHAESAPAAGRIDDAAAAGRHTDDTAADARRRVESDARTLRSSPFASRRFHVLLNSLFKVLFNFPSRYLCAIGLASVFSLRWSLPPALGCNLKQPDSEDYPGGPAGCRRGLTPALGEAPIRRTRTPNRSPRAVPNTTVPVAR